MKAYKYMIITQNEGETFLDNPVYRIRNKRSGVELGVISYYKTWKEYVFSQSAEGIIFNNSCLRDIIDFMENEIPKLTPNPQEK